MALPVPAEIYRRAALSRQGGNHLNLITIAHVAVIFAP
jgi:hypothetical protein